MRLVAFEHLGKDDNGHEYASGYLELVYQLPRGVGYRSRSMGGGDQQRDRDLGCLLASFDARDVQADAVRAVDALRHSRLRWVARWSFLR